MHTYLMFGEDFFFYRSLYTIQVTHLPPNTEVRSRGRFIIIIGVIIGIHTCKGENALKTFITYIHHKQYKFHLILTPPPRLL
jgi:hypothetical protein